MCDFQAPEWSMHQQFHKDWVTSSCRYVEASCIVYIATNYSQAVTTNILETISEHKDRWMYVIEQSIS